MPKTITYRRHFLIIAPLVLAACGSAGSRYQGMAPDELFQLATTEFAEQDYKNAIRALDRLLLAHGDWDRVPDARLLLGNVYFANEDYLTARSEYTRFLDRYAGHASSPDAALGICRALSLLAPNPHRDQTYTDEALTSCRNVVVDYSGMQQSNEAAAISAELRLTLAEKEYLNGAFYFRRRIWDSAIKYFTFVADLYPESEFAAAALLGLYESNQAIGYDDLAEEARERILAQYPDSEAATSVRATDGSGS